MIITTERLHYLWAVAETGSFAAAGRRLGVSGAAVQQVIRHFEQDLDAPLFRRSPGRRPVLTGLGRQLDFFHSITSQGFWGYCNIEGKTVNFRCFFVRNMV